MNPFSLLVIASNLHKSISWVKLLTKFNDALQIIIEQFLRFQVKLILTKCLLVSFYHHENDLLVFIRAFEEVLKVALFLNLILSLFDVINVVRLILSSCFFQFLLYFIDILVIILLVLSFTLVKNLVVIFFTCFSLSRFLRRSILRSLHSLSQIYLFGLIQLLIHFLLLKLLLLYRCLL